MDAAGPLLSLPYITSDSTTPGPNAAEHTPSRDSVVQPRSADSILKSASTSRKSPASVFFSSEHTAANDETDYFSQDTTPPARPDRSSNSFAYSSIASSNDGYGAEGFVQNARKGLYGTSGASDSEKLGHGIIGGNSAGFYPVPAASASDVPRVGLSRSTAGLPEYPNQSYAALQAQVYPQYHHAPYNSRGNSSTNPQNPISAVTNTRSPARILSLHDRRSGTNTNPTNVPSLFVPSAPTTRPFHGYEGSDERSPYPSPYLHPVQLQPPRTVTNAKKDVDVFSGRKMINHYEILGELGRGVHGKVKLARDLNTGDEVAIKIVQRYSKKKRLGKASSTEDKVKKEVAILKKAQHPNVVRMIEVIDDPEVAQVYIVLEFCESKEINWRVLGTTPIIILENRRLEQESQGLPADDVCVTDRTMLAVTRRLEEAHIRPVRNHRTKSASHIWSLEYGGDSDNDSEEDDPVQVMPKWDSGARYFSDQASANRPFDDVNIRYADDRVAPEEPAGMPISATPRRRPSTSPNDATTVARETEFGSFNTNMQSGYSPQWQRWSLPPRSDSTDDNRGRRKTSGTESLSSQLTEIMQDEIPEDYRYVPTMTISECRSAFRDALIGLDYLHYHGIVHRDIKPANLLCTRDHRVKISDFGVSYLGKPIREGQDSADTSESESKDIDDETELAKTVGTPAFYAPELCYLDYISDVPTVTGQIDVWALGVTLYCLLFARTPFLGENEFMLMKKIAEQEVFIPRLRLKAVEVSPAPKSPSHGISFRNRDDSRLPDDFIHEYIDDELFDLLKKLLTKDPRKRITIKDIKRHPWILRDVTNATSWPDETDPARYEQGRKIEISSKEVEEAVIPITLVKRIKSITSRASRVLGLGGKASRSRAQSSANPSVASSFQSLVDVAARDERQQEERKHNMHPEESIYAALKASRERDIAIHPLSRSVTASPDPGSPRSETGNHWQVASSSHSPVRDDIVRPSMPERQISELSTAGSTRTIRPADMERGRQPSVASIQEDMPVLQTVLGQPNGATLLSGVFGGVSDGLWRTMRSKELQLPIELSDNHGPRTPFGGPSVAISNTSVAGHVDTSASLREGSGTESSPGTSRKSSLAEVWEGSRHHDLPKSTKVDAQITGQVGTYDNFPTETHGGLPAGGPPLHGLGGVEYDHAMENLARRHAVEMERSQERYNAARNASGDSSRPMTSSGEMASLDDDDDYDNLRRGRGQTPHARYGFLIDKNSSNALLPYNVQGISSTSSDDHLASNTSQSTSYPSVQSIISGDTSLPEIEYMFDPKSESSASSDGTIGVHTSFRRPRSEEPNESVNGEQPEDEATYGVVTDEDDDDSDDDDEGILIMSRRKSRTQASACGSNSTTASTASRRHQSTLRQKTYARSGSANTMRKVRSHSSGEAERSL